jgi:hypothetical protein
MEGLLFPSVLGTADKKVMPLHIAQVRAMWVCDIEVVSRISISSRGGGAVLQTQSTGACRAAVTLEGAWQQHLDE